MCLFIYQLDIFGIIKPATSGFCRFANHQRCDLLLGIPMYTPTWDYCNVGPKSYKLVFGFLNPINYSYKYHKT